MFILWILIIVIILLWRRTRYEEKSVSIQSVTTEEQENELIESPQQQNEGGATIIITEPPVDGMTTIGDDMNGSTIVMKIGETVKVLLRGNATTGYAWRIVKMEGSSVMPDEKWYYKPNPSFLIGSGGYFQRKFQAVEVGVSEVFFIYDPVSDPMNLSYSYYLRFDVRY